MPPKSMTYSTQRTRVLSPGEIANILAAITWRRDGGDDLGRLGVQAPSAWSSIAVVRQLWRSWGRVVAVLTVAKITRSAAGGYAEYLDGKTRSAGPLLLPDAANSARAAAARLHV